MTRDDVIRLAIECQLVTTGNRDGLYMAALERFAALVAAHEREECAAICDNAEKRKWLTFTQGGEAKGFSTSDCASAIRARGEK